MDLCSRGTRFQYLRPQRGTDFVYNIKIHVYIKLQMFKFCKLTSNSTAFSPIDTTTKMGQRASTYHAFLKDILTRKNLKIVRYAMVDKVTYINLLMSKLFRNYINSCVDFNGGKKCGWSSLYATWRKD